MESFLRSKRFVRSVHYIGLLFCLSLIFPPLQLKAGPIAEGCDKFLGNISTAGPPSNFLNYWNQVTLENNGKWVNIEPARDQMKWGPVQAAYDYCQKNKIPYKHHTFLWNEQYPTWLDGLSAADKKAEVEELIREFGQKFPETAVIDVVNECREKSPKWRDALGGAGETGYDWIVWGFQTTRKYCPKAKLLINEYYCEYNLEFVTEYLKIIKVLKEKNLIDGIGVQTHSPETIKGFQMGTLKKCLDSLATSGVPLYSTELDLAGNDQEQLKAYQDIFPIIWEHPAMRGVTLWGYIVGQTWMENAGLINGGTERPALKWLRQYVAEHKETSSIRAHNTFSIAPFHRASPVMACSPANGNCRVLITPSGSGGISMQLFDMLGRRVSSIRSDNLDGQVVFTFPGSCVPRSPFVLKATDRNGSYAKQVIPLR